MEPFFALHLLLEERPIVEGKASFWIVAAAILGYILLSFTNPAKRFFKDGWRCLNRYPRIWIWLSIFGATYTLFQAVLAYQMGEVSPLTAWPEFKPVLWSLAANRAWLPALELLSGLFNQAVTTYPLSAVGALLFLINWRGYHGQFLASAKRKYGRWRWAVYPGILLSALAALCKPIFSLSIYRLNQYFGGIFLLRLGAVIDWLSFQFEYLSGFLLQIFLILSILVWVRGLNASPDRILELAVKRGIYAAKWAGIVLGLTCLLIHLPLLLSYFWIAQQTDFSRGAVLYVEQTARPLLAIGLIFFCSIQLTLILHNETVAQVVGEHALLARRHWSRLFWFLFVSGFNLLAVCFLEQFLSGGFPKYSGPGLLVSLSFTILKGLLAGWYLATWVCLYRGSKEGKDEIQF